MADSAYRKAVRRSAPQLGLSLGLVAASLCGCGDIGSEPEDTGTAFDAENTEGGADTPDGGDVPREPGTVEYVLDWDTSGLVLEPTGGWVVTTDLGYEVTLDAGWLVSYSVQLTQCETARSRFGAALRRALAALSPIQTAWAGHGDDNDVSAALGIVEDLASPTSSVRSGLQLGETDYCGVHYLVARADEDVIDRPDGVTLDRLSLVTSGRYTRLSDGEVGEFSIETSTGFGVLLELPNAAVIRTGDAPIVRVTRTLGGAFDGVDIATATDVDLERALVRALVESAWVELQ